ncbi:MAG: hypothetical protein AAFQ82_17065 [Myxococcota bacterium]
MRRLDPILVAVILSWGCFSSGPDNTCGDGRVENGEACDRGELNSDSRADACRTNCSLPGCGDSVVDSGETCDNSSPSCMQCQLTANTAPRFTSSAQVQVSENEASSFYTATATDLEESPLLFEIVAGGDSEQFILEGESGALSFRTPPDFEFPADLDGNNDYELQLRVTDILGAFDTLTLTILVTDEADGELPCASMPCFDGVACTDIPGGFECGSCPRGYTGDGVDCSDIDECLAFPCDALVDCTNLEGGFVCGSCPTGFQDLNGDGTACVDINECATDVCDPLPFCTNTPGGFFCGECRGPQDCNDGTVCTSDECLNDMCVNAPVPDRSDCSAERVDGLCRAGECVECISEGDCNDNNECTIDT